MKPIKSLFENLPDIIPPVPSKGMSVTDLIKLMGKTSFEARNVYQSAKLYKSMIRNDDIIWLGIAGAGIAGGMGGMVIELLKAGFIDVICSTGAQVYHDLHFAFDLPVKAIHPHSDDELLRRHGDTRIYDIGIRENETLKAQDDLIRSFVRDNFWDHFSNRTISSWQFNQVLGEWVLKNAKYPERSFVACAAQANVPVFWDSLANHSIAMNLIVTDNEGFQVSMLAQNDILDSAAISYSTESTSFIELGGGGPKNFIQQTGPTISQILKIPHEGAESGIQISTAFEREGSLSGCTFSEAKTWGKYRNVDEKKLVQIWGEYSIIFPLLVAYILENCENRPLKKLTRKIPILIERLNKAG
jgi:deoxyhypusine synthase